MIYLAVAVRPVPPGPGIPGPVPIFSQTPFFLNDLRFFLLPEMRIIPAVPDILK
jgi:hypothetical protein